ncbi:hypothetical protein AB0L83_32075 [Streptomyces sp. NPDC052071]|uniref:hypothetical protein n=1 Tax=Streptomyces sp. NPDC052071 TaxID=3156666 RepID=UPI003426F029
MSRIVATLLASAALVAAVATSGITVDEAQDVRQVTADDGFGWGGPKFADDAPGRQAANDDGFGWVTPRVADGNGSTSLQATAGDGFGWVNPHTTDARAGI